jgi:hypothetical protein
MHLSPWPLVAAVYNLEVAEGLRDGEFIDAQTARRMAARALAKLIRALAKQGIDRATVVAYFRLRDEGDARQHANLAMLLPPPTRTRDEADPRRARSLRMAR